MRSANGSQQIRAIWHLNMILTCLVCGCYLLIDLSIKTSNITREHDSSTSRVGVYFLSFINILSVPCNSATRARQNGDFLVQCRHNAGTRLPSLSQHCPISGPTSDADHSNSRHPRLSGDDLLLTLTCKSGPVDHVRAFWQLFGLQLYTVRVSSLILTLSARRPTLVVRFFKRQNLTSIDVRVWLP